MDHDVWLMHRDNPDVPVGEIVDVLNEHQAAGRMTIFGVSNWPLPRLREAREYADRNGRSYFSVVSNQIIGTRLPGETRDCLRALEVTLSAEEARWLDLGEE